MASSISLGYPLWADGQLWTSLLQRQLAGGVAVWDTNASATVSHPLGGVFHGPAKPLCVAPLATPGMSVLVNAGYIAVPHPTVGHGTYLFGLLAQATLTVPANTSGASRTDIVIARVYDLGTTSSYCDIEYITGTPGAGQPATPGVSIVLGAVTVASGATSIAAGNITDLRTFTVAPGGILPTTTANAPPVAPGQLLWNLSGAGLQTVTPAVTESVTFNTSTSWVSPITGLVWVEGTGGDGGGGGGYQDVNGNGSTQGGAGGGGGEWAGDWIAVTAGRSYPVEIGQGGYRGSGGTNSSGTATLGSPGSDGTATTFTGDTQTLTANPGKGGQGGGTNFPNAGGLGGTGSTNAYHQPGGQGGSGSQVSVSGQGGGSRNRAYGGGGGAAGTQDAPGGAGQNGTSTGPGAGGTAGPGGGDGGDGGDVGSNGAPGNAPGGGGGGGYADTSTYWQAGGNGSDGQVTLTWTVQPAALTSVFTQDSDPGEDISDVNTSTGTSGSNGITAGSGSAYGWGIGYGSTNSEGGYYEGWGYYYGGGNDADGQSVPQIQVSFDADGSTDFQIDVKWGLTVPEAAVDSSSPSIPRGQCRLIVMIDDQVIDQIYLSCAASGGVLYPGDAGAFTMWTSAQTGTTPGSGLHTATLAIETSNTLSGEYSGAHIGNLASVGQSPYPFTGGALPSGFTSALTAENCSLRVAGIANSAV